MSIYTDKIIEGAKAAGMDAAKAAGLTYAEVAAMAGVVIEKNGDSPADFFYQLERHQLAQVLAAAETAALAETLRAETQKAIAATLDTAGSVTESVKVAAIKTAGLTEFVKAAEATLAEVASVGENP